MDVDILNNNLLSLSEEFCLKWITDASLKIDH